MATLKDEIARWTQGPTQTGLPVGESAVGQNGQGPGARSATEAAVGVSAASMAASANYYILKKQLHLRLLARMDLSSIESLSTEQLQSQLSTTLWALLQEEPLLLWLQLSNPRLLILCVSRRMSRVMALTCALGTHAWRSASVSMRGPALG